MAIQCDVTMYFGGGQPHRTQHVWRADDEEHAKRLALLDSQAKGWDVRKIVPSDIVVTGVVQS